MGRRVAGRALAQGITSSLRPNEQLRVLAGHRGELPVLRDLLQPLLPVGAELWLGCGLGSEQLKQLGCLHLPDPGLAHWCQLRAGLPPSSFSITGVTHTLCSKAVVQGLEALVTAPLECWDALICTSTAAKEVAERAISRQLEVLERRFGQQLRQPAGPQLPIIPLAIDPESFQDSSQGLDRSRRRQLARQRLGINTDDYVVLFLGRLSFHSKAHPLPLYKALATLSQSAPVLLLECGHLFNAAIETAYNDLAAQFPTLRVKRLGGQTPATEDEKILALWAADVFCSPADNLQETFGLSLLEAMAAELPIIASDWNGYRDLVDHGVTGLLIPTSDQLKGQTLTDELERQYRIGLVDYDSMIYQRSQCVVVDHQALETALKHLHDQPEQRQKMGSAGQDRLQRQFSWTSVAQQYRRLWEELNDLRQAAAQASQKAWPTSDYGSLFGHYSTHIASTTSFRITTHNTSPEFLLKPMQKGIINRWCNQSSCHRLVQLLLDWRDRQDIISEETWHQAANALGIQPDHQRALLIALEKLGVIEGMKA